MFCLQGHLNWFSSTWVMKIALPAWNRDTWLKKNCEWVIQMPVNLDLFFYLFLDQCKVTNSIENSLQVDLTWKVDPMRTTCVCLCIQSYSVVCEWPCEVCPVGLWNGCDYVIIIIACLVSTFPIGLYSKEVYRIWIVITFRPAWLSLQDTAGL